MSKKNDPPADGCESVADAVDAYVKHGVDAIGGLIGPASQRENPEFVAAYIQGCAVIHAAEIVAQALDRQSAAVANLAHTLGSK